MRDCCSWRSLNHLQAAIHFLKNTDIGLVRIAIPLLNGSFKIKWSSGFERLAKASLSRTCLDRHKNASWLLAHNSDRRASDCLETWMEPAFGLMIVLSMDHAKAPGKGTTAREPITVFSMNRRSLTPEREDTASRVNASKPTKKQPELITWEEIIGKR